MSGGTTATGVIVNWVGSSADGAMRKGFLLPAATQCEVGLSQIEDKRQRRQRQEIEKKRQEAAENRRHMENEEKELRRSKWEVRTIVEHMRVVCDAVTLT